MAEILGSAVASESISKLFSILSGNAREHESNDDRSDRLEMAVLKIHSVVAVSEDWQIVHQPLLNWKAKLKRVAKEGDGILRAHKRKSTERERSEETARRASVPKRVARAVKRFMPFGRGGGDDDDHPSDAVVRRFERFAATADEFFRYVRFGGRPKSLMIVSLKVPVESLRAGKTLEVSLRNGSRDALLLLQPRDGESGSREEAILLLSYDDDTMTWERNVKLSVVFRISEQIDDVLGIVMSSLELLPPQFGAACVTIRESVRAMVMQGTSYSDPSVMSVWCGATVWKCCTETSADRGCTDGKLQLPIPMPIIRISALCFTLPVNNSSSAPANGSLPLRLTCHVSPNLVPNKFYHHYEQIEPQTLQELLPEVADGGIACGGQWWCPRSSTYLSVEPTFTVPPPTRRQLYMTENSERSV